MKQGILLPISPFSTFAGPMNGCAEMLCLGQVLGVVSMQSRL